MASHANAKLTPRGRLTLVTRILGGQSARSVAAAFGVSASTARKWVRRYQAGGPDGLLDRSSRPRVMPSKVPGEIEDRVEALRRSGLTYALIAANLAMPISTVASSVSAGAPPAASGSRPSERAFASVVPIVAIPEGRYDSDNGGHSMSGNGAKTGTATVKRGLAQMLKGGVIMDVVTPEQAAIAQEAGAVAVMAIERIPRTSAPPAASPG